MEFKEKYNQNKILEIKTICDNLFYNDYLKTGILDSTYNIKNRIRTQTIDSLLMCFGKSSKEIIKNRVDSTEINFTYQILGPRNSISNFLKEVKTDNFNTLNGTNFKYPESISALLKVLKTDGFDFLSSCYDLFEECYKHFDVTPEQIKSSTSLKNLLVSQLEILSNSYNSIKYSDNPQINSNMEVLEELVGDFKDYLKEYVQGMGIPEISMIDELDQMINENCRGIKLDPLANSDKRCWDMLRYTSIAGKYCGSCQGVYLGIFPSDDTIIHEFIHAVSQGFEVGHEARPGSEDIARMMYREHEALNECVTDYLAVKIVEERKIKGMEKICNDTFSPSLYSDLFDVLGPFIDSYLPEITNAYMRNCPAEEMMRVMGKENFDRLAILSNELLCLSDVELSDLEKLGDENNAESLNEVGLKKDKINEASDITNKTIHQHGKLRRLVNFVYSKSDIIVKRLHKSDSQSLKKIAKILYSVPQTMKDLMNIQKMDMGKPFENIDEFTKFDELEKEENEFVMEKQINKTY